MTFRSVKVCSAEGTFNQTAIALGNDLQPLAGVGVVRIECQLVEREAAAGADRVAPGHVAVEPDHRGRQAVQRGASAVRLTATEEHGGTISLEDSTAEGTTFLITLPVVESQEYRVETAAPWIAKRVLDGDLRARGVTLDGLREALKRDQDWVEQELVEFAHAASTLPAKPGLLAQYLRSASIFLVSAIAFAGFRPFGQVCVQFMIV